MHGHGGNREFVGQYWFVVRCGVCVVHVRRAVGCVHADRVCDCVRWCVGDRVWLGWWCGAVGWRVDRACCCGCLGCVLRYLEVAVGLLWCVRGDLLRDVVGNVFDCVVGWWCFWCGCACWC